MNRPVFSDRLVHSTRFIVGGLGTVLNTRFFVGGLGTVLCVNVRVGLNIEVGVLIADLYGFGEVVGVQLRDGVLCFRVLLGFGWFVFFVFFVFFVDVVHVSIIEKRRGGAYWVNHPLRPGLVESDQGHIRVSPDVLTGAELRQ